MSESNLEVVRLHAIVEGRVQGVGFRFFVQENAIMLGLTGWVRNRWDRTVELVAEGQKGDLENLLAAVLRGPRAVIVNHVKPTWKPATGEFSGYHVRPTR